MTSTVYWAGIFEGFWFFDSMGFSLGTIGRNADMYFGKYSMGQLHFLSNKGISLNEAVVFK